jgi:hypothetical protein
MAKNTQSADDEEFRALIDHSMEELRLKTQAHSGVWGLGATDRWDLDQEDGNLIFTSEKFTARAPAQIIGTYSSESGTWLWAWDHPSVLEPLRRDARRVREHGETHGITALTTRELECTETEAWQFTALACHLCGAQGAYRGPAGVALVFMTFGKVTLSAGKDPDGAPSS